MILNIKDDLSALLDGDPDLKSLMLRLNDGRANPVFSIETYMFIRYITRIYEDDMDALYYDLTRMLVVDDKLEMSVSRSVLLKSALSVYGGKKTDLFIQMLGLLRDKDCWKHFVSATEKFKTKSCKERK